MFLVKLHAKDEEQVNLIRYHLALADVGKQTGRDSLMLMHRVLRSLREHDAIQDFHLEHDPQSSHLYHVKIAQPGVARYTEYDLDTSILTKEWAVCWEIHES